MQDEGHYVTELILRETEADVRRVYQQAVEETQKKLEDYLRRYQIKDQIKREQLARGEITAKEYSDWKKGQILIGQRWEEMRDTLAQDLHNSNVIARSIVQGHMPEAYAVNHNYATFQIEKGSMVDTSYTLYDRQTVERIIRDQPELLPPPGKNMLERIAANKDIAWQRGQIQSVAMQSILQGESIPKMARRIAREMGEKNNKAAVRYARTAMTGAQNAGRVDAYERANKMGIETEKEWLATLDDRTRDSHVWIDGEHVGVNETFSNGCRFPGDPYGPGYEVWNCRCTLVPRVKGVDQSNAPRNSKLGDMTYDEWKHEHENIGEDKGRVMVDGRDITSTWVWDPNKYDFAIDSAVHEQGFDGLPRVVSADEFDQLYVGGDQPLMLRTYSAKDEETLAAYHKTLTDGKFYVDCSAGGANYGQGMYTAGIYAEKGSKQFDKKFNGAMEEMAHYSSIMGRGSRPSLIETMTLDPSAKIVKLSDLKKEPEYKEFVKRYSRYVQSSMYSEQISGLRGVISSASYLDNEVKKDMLGVLSKAESMVSSRKFSKAYDAINSVMQKGSEAELGGSFSYFKNAEATQMSRVIFSSSQKWGGLKSASELAPEGVYATIRGYDAINAFGHGASGSYTIVLNRTKLIVKESAYDNI